MPEEKAESVDAIPDSINVSPVPDNLTAEDLKLTRGLKTANVFTWTVWIIALCALLFQAYSGLQPGGDIAFTTQVAQIVFWVLIAICLTTDVIWRLVYIRSHRQGVKKLQAWAEEELDYKLSTYQAYTLARTLKNKAKDQDDNIIIASAPVKGFPPAELGDPEEKVLLRLLSTDEDGLTLTFRSAADKNAPWAPIPNLRLRTLIQGHSAFIAALHENDDRVFVPFNKATPPEPILAVGDDGGTYAFVFSSEKEAHVWAFKERAQIATDDVTLVRLTLEEFTNEFADEINEQTTEWGVILNSGNPEVITITKALIPLYFQESLPWLETNNKEKEVPAEL